MTHDIFIFYAISLLAIEKIKEEPRYFVFLTHDEQWRKQETLFFIQSRPSALFSMHAIRSNQCLRYIEQAGH